jgi:hypothetical protein
MGLQREIVGDLLDTADLNQVRAAGAVLARLQDALAAYPDAEWLSASCSRFLYLGAAPGGRPQPLLRTPPP